MADNSSRATQWIEEMFLAWKEKDYDAIRNIFSECRYYMEDPFLPVAVSIDEIMELWSEIALQKEVNLGFEVISSTETKAVYRWKAKIVSDSAIELDGIYAVRFSNSWKCIEFLQWTVEKAV